MYWITHIGIVLVLTFFAFSEKIFAGLYDSVGSLLFEKPTRVFRAPTARQII